MNIEARKLLAGKALNDVYAETEQIVQENIETSDGKLTYGLDGHTDGRGRSVVTISALKKGVSIFVSAEHLKTTRHTGQNLAELMASKIKGHEDKVLAVVADNTGNMVCMQEYLLIMFPYLFVLGCGVHVLDLLIEDICKIKWIKEVLEDVHFIISFTKTHSLIFEEFLILSAALSESPQPVGLKLYPQTRFAYAPLSIFCVLVNWAAFCKLVESAVFVQCKSAAHRRGGESGEKGETGFVRFKNLITGVSGPTKPKMDAVHALLEPFSDVLHYLEGDSVPTSHIFPLYDHLLQYAGTLPQNVKEVLPQEVQKTLPDLVKDRWLGSTGQHGKVGIMNDVHLACFGMDIAARTVCRAAPALKEGDTPNTRLWNTNVTTAMDTCMRHLAKAPVAADEEDDSEAKKRGRENQRAAKEASLVSSLNEFKGGQGVYKAIIKTAVEQASKEAQAADEKLLRDNPDAKDKHIKRLINKLQAVGSPVPFWHVARAEQLHDSTGDEFAKHQMFCSSVIDLHNIVYHTCAVERHGKGYKLIHTALRTSIGEQRLSRLLFIFHNYGYLHKLIPVSRLPKNHEKALEDFIFDALEEEEAQELRAAIEEEDTAWNNAVDRNALVLPEENFLAPEGSDGGDEEHEDEEVAQEYVIPAEFEVVEDTPTQIDKSLLQMWVFMNWDVTGWEIGQIKHFYPRGVILRDDKGVVMQGIKGNVSIKWAKDGRGILRDTFLQPNLYGGSAQAEVGSWVLLKRKPVKPVGST